MLSLTELTPFEFREFWYRSGGELVKWPQDALSDHSLEGQTIDWLTNAGLPPAALPYLRFDSPLAQSKEQAQKKYVFVGTCNDGDVIAIDTEANDAIYWLDSENDLAPGFFNSSLAQLLGSLLLYREFVMEIKRTRGEAAYSKSDFTDLEFERLKNGLLQLDPVCMQEGSFWKIQLDMDLQLRRENLR